MAKIDEAVEAAVNEIRKKADLSNIESVFELFVNTSERFALTLDEYPATMQKFIFGIFAEFGFTKAQVDEAFKRLAGNTVSESIEHAKATEPEEVTEPTIYQVAPGKAVIDYNFEKFCRKQG